jgi:hypothetical protein
MISTESIVVERERAKCMHQYNICIDQIQQPQKIKTWKKPVTAGPIYYWNLQFLNNVIIIKTEV